MKGNQLIFKGFLKITFKEKWKIKVLGHTSNTNQLEEQPIELHMSYAKKPSSKAEELENEMQRRKAERERKKRRED